LFAQLQRDRLEPRTDSVALVKAMSRCRGVLQLGEYGVRPSGSGFLTLFTRIASVIQRLVSLERRQSAHWSRQLVRLPRRRCSAQILRCVVNNIDAGHHCRCAYRRSYVPSLWRR